MKRNLLMIFLTLCCCVVGYGFYKMNGRDIITGFFVAFGLLGILLSVIREGKLK